MMHPTIKQRRDADSRRLLLRGPTQGARGQGEIIREREILRTGAGLGSWANGGGGTWSFFLGFVRAFFLKEKVEGGGLCYWEKSFKAGFIFLARTMDLKGGRGGDFKGRGFKLNFSSATANSSPG